MQSTWPFLKIQKSTHPMRLLYLDRIGLYWFEIPKTMVLLVSNNLQSTLDAGINNNLCKPPPGCIAELIHQIKLELVVRDDEILGVEESGGSDLSCRTDGL